MNRLLIGTADKTEQLLQHAHPPFLLITDVADAFLEAYPRASIFNPHKHSFNPLRDMNHLKARSFANLLYSLSPQGENTLTVRGGKRKLAEILMYTKRLDKFPHGVLPAEQEAAGMIDEVLFSPVVRSVICGSQKNFFFDTKKVIIARLSRAELGDFDCKVIAALLIGQFKGQVLVPDFGFYKNDLYLNLIQENRLTVGLNYLDELPRDMQQAVLSIKDKIIYRTTRDDAERLIFYTRHTEPRNITDLEEGAFLAGA